MESGTALKFPSTAAMLDHLTTIPASEINKIRSIYLKSFPFPLYTDEELECYRTYNMSETLALFPGLALDLLSVEDPYHDPDVNDGWGDTGTYGDVQSLLESKGWKELHYTSPTTEFLSTFDDGPESNDPRRPQPQTWDKLMKERDGKDSGAEVKLFIAKEPGKKGVAGDPVEGMPYEAVPGSSLKFDEDEEMVVDAREVLIVAKRGRDADYVQDGSDVDAKIKGVWDTMSWKEIKESGRYIDPEEDPCSHL